MERLTRREREVSLLLMEEKTDKEIGAILTVSVNTARTHIKNIRRKLGISHRGWARLLELEPEDGNGNETAKNHQNGD